MGKWRKAPRIRRCVRGQMKCDGTRVETRFHLSAKRTSPFKSAGVSVQSTTGSRGVRISGSNARYTMFRGSVKSTGYPLHSPVFSSLPLPCVTVCHHFNWSLRMLHMPVALSPRTEPPVPLNRTLGGTRCRSGGRAVSLSLSGTEPWFSLRKACS